MKKRLIAVFLIAALLLCSCGAKANTAENHELKIVRSMELKYADQFSVDYCEDGSKFITIKNDRSYLIVPEGKETPEGVPQGTVVLHAPVKNIYLAATSAMCLFDAIDGLDSIRLSGTKASGWYIPNARKAMEDGKILFAGKYSEPDYELMLKEKCSLAIESTMINHSPDIAEMLNSLGIPVFTEHSGYESHPLGRVEWIRLYGALLDKEEIADRLFEEQTSYLKEVEGLEPTGKTISFFSMSASGRVTVRKSGDYISKMIALAGGTYIFSNIGDPESNTSTQTIEMETFYAQAKDADFMIYNNTVGTKCETIKDLLELSPLLSDFKAVKEGKVWCTEQNMFQESVNLGQMIKSFNLIASGRADGDVPYLSKLK